MDIPTNLSGWRILFNASNANPGLFVQRDQLQRAKDAALDDCNRGGKTCRIIGAACADGPEQATAKN